MHVLLKQPIISVNIIILLFKMHVLLKQPIISVNIIILLFKMHVLLHKLHDLTAGILIQ